MNSRIKDVAGIPGAKSEAIASVINVDYQPLAPETTNVLFSYRDYVVDASGSPLPFMGDKWTPVNLTLAELQGIVGEEIVTRVVADMKLLADLIYDHKFPAVIDEPLS